MITRIELQEKSSQAVLSLIQDLQQQLLQKEQALKAKDQTIESLTYRLNVMLQHRFGKKQDQLPNPHQGYLFDEALVPENADEIESADDAITVARFKRKKPGRKPLPKHLARIQRIHDLEPFDKTCHCGCALSQIGSVKSEQLEFIPAQVRVIEHVRLKYACKQCEETIRLAPLPKQPIPKSIATPGLLSHVLISKYQDHLPLYRQEQMLTRLGIDIERSTLSHWMIKCGKLLAPLVDAMQQHLITDNVGYADETTLQVLKEPGRSPQTKSYMWLFIGGPADKQGFIYQYHPSRSHEIPKQFWRGFSGYLHTDGYSGYQALFKKTKIKGVHCWAHARRKFTDIAKMTNKKGLAHHAVVHIAKLYTIEKSMKENKLLPKAIVDYRKQHSKPLLLAFKQWLGDYIRTTPPASPIGKAMAYCLKYWGNLMRYLEDGRLEIDNNRAERSIKPFVMGRKAWLFSNSVQGAKAGAIIYSLIETCKAHNIEPYSYFKYVLSEIVHCQTNADYEKLLPYHIDKATLQNQWVAA